MKLAPTALLRRFFLDQWRAIDAEVEAERREEEASRGPAPKKKVRKGKKGKQKAVESSTEPRKFDWRPVIFLITVAITLTLQEYFGTRGSGQGRHEVLGFMDMFPRKDFPDMEEKDYQLLSFCWWSGWRFLGYVVIPVITIWLMPGQRVRDYFVSLKGFFKHLWIYAALFALILPAVIFASTQKSFTLTYPFYKWANQGMGYFLAWQALYALQFVSLEFFFRGYMLAGLRDRLGSSAIFVMLVPYCMIHYGKPVLETLGAIIAGLVLGTLAMRTRSIWGGAIIHIAVAVTMDSLALGNCPDASTGMPCKGH